MQDASSSCRSHLAPISSDRQLRVRMYREWLHQHCMSMLHVPSQEQSTGSTCPQILDTQHTVAQRCMEESRVVRRCIIMSQVVRTMIVITRRLSCATPGRGNMSMPDANKAGWNALYAWMKCAGEMRVDTRNFWPFFRLTMKPLKATGIVKSSTDLVRA